MEEDALDDQAVDEAAWRELREGLGRHRAALLLDQNWMMQRFLPQHR